MIHGYLSFYGDGKLATPRYNMLIGLWRQWNEENERGGEKRIVGEAMIIQGRQTLIDVISNILGAQWNMFTLVLSFDFGLTGSVAFIKR